MQRILDVSPSSDGASIRGCAAGGNCDVHDGAIVRGHIPKSGGDLTKAAQSLSRLSCGPDLEEKLLTIAQLLSAPMLITSMCRKLQVKQHIGIISNSASASPEQRMSPVCAFHTRWSECGCMPSCRHQGHDTRASAVPASSSGRTPQAERFSQKLVC